MAKTLTKTKAVYQPWYKKTLVFGRGDEGKKVRDHIKAAAKIKAIGLCDFILESAIEEANELRRDARPAEPAEDEDTIIIPPEIDQDGHHWPPPPTSKPT